MQSQKVLAKKSFKIDDLSKELGVKKFIIKNWEKQFELKRIGSDNKYSQEDFKIFAAIKNLIFVQKVPQGQVKKHLQDILDGNYVKVITNSVCTTQELEQAPQEQIQQEQVQELEVAQAPSDNDSHQTIKLSEPQIQIECQQTPEIKIEDPAPIFMAQPEPQILAKLEPQVEPTAQPYEEQTYQCAQSEQETEPQETKSDEIIAATTTEEMTDTKLVFKEKEKFMKNLQSFKEKLIRIHEQLK